MASGVALTVVLAAFVAAHGMLVGGLARRRAWGRAVVALVVPPLAPWWGWGAGLRVATVVWCAALALYTAGVVALAT
jgi:hypothetical protein